MKTLPYCSGKNRIWKPLKILLIGCFCGSIFFINQGYGQNTDFGDAPDDYGTTLAEDGPRHDIPGYNETANTAPLMLGTQISHETDGQPSVDADADTFEDGVAGPIVLTHDQPNTITVTVTNNTAEPATLAGWIDQNQATANGVFGNGAERELISIPANSGTQDYDLTFPAPAHFDDTYARFRLFPGAIDDADALPNGPAAAGEVEDYPVTVELEAWACTPDGILSQGGGPTQLQFVDLVTGDVETGVIELDGRTTNAMAYNVVDDYIYAWDATVPSGSTQVVGIVRIGADGEVQELGIPTGMNPDDTEGGQPVGDIDDNGHYWFGNSTGSGQNARWYQIDLNPGSTTFMQVLESGQMAGNSTGIPEGRFAGSGDWAWVPGGGDNLWRVMRNTDNNNNWHLIRFDRSTGTNHNMGQLPALNPEGASTFGAVFADEQFLYVSNNTSGNIYRVDVVAGTASFFTGGPPSGNNDGARCAIAPINTDYGDAPEEYGTLLNDDGPRHGLRDYDPDNNTTSLMLGTQVSHETNGQPSDDADTDSFEDGVAGPIVLTHDQPNTVTVTVTNNTAEPATLAGWIDQNQLFANGVFGNGAEREMITIPANSGTQNYDLTFPAPAHFNDTYARFRLFPGEVTDPQPTGPASAGEVEDYPVMGEMSTWECTPDGLLFQYPGGPPTQVQFVGLVTGDVDVGELSISGRSINATAHNMVDDYVYGWDNQLANGGPDRVGIVKIGANGLVQELGVPNHPDLDPEDSFIVGDIDGNGHYWVSNAGGSHASAVWYQIDLNPGPNFMQVLDWGPVGGVGDLPVGGYSSGADWAWVPGGGDNLWRVMQNNGTNRFHLIRFDMNTGEHYDMGVLPSLDSYGSTPGFGAAYADSEFLYISDNDSGDIIRIDIQNATASFFTDGPPSNTNDGARCPVPVYTDYGDAPDSHGTLLSSSGPRHGLRDYDPDTNTTSLMLGSNVSHESDGQPSANADADNPGNGLVSGIMLDLANPIEVEMLVTNNTDSAATLVGWIDLDGTGTFDAGDRSDIITIPANTTDTFTLTFAQATTTTDTYARFRLYPGEVDEGDLSPLGPVSAGEVEDYPVPTDVVDIELTGGPCWRLLSSPVQGLTYADMLENLWTQGAAGSDYPGGTPNIFLWPNGQSGNDPSGWQPLGDLNQVIPPGSGFLISVFADDDYDGVDDPFPKRLSVSGPAHTGDITPPVNSTDGGWTLVGNPYTQPVDFSALTTNELTDIGYVYDRNYTGADGGDTNGNTGGWRSTDGTYGDVTGGAFAPGQGFFVQNTSPAASPSITFTEGSQTTGGEFHGKEKELRDYVRLEVQGESLYNSMWIRFSGDGSVEPAYGDALELQPLAEQYALLGARKTDGTLVDIGHFPLPDDALEIPVHVEATQPGSYTLTATDLDIPGGLSSKTSAQAGSAQAGTELYLHDLETGQTVAITESFEYTFTISQAAKATPDEGITSCSSEPAKAKTMGGSRFMITTSASGADGELPDEVALGQNYPNPFNPSTQITYQLPAASEVRLEVFNVLGRRVATLVEGTVQAGVHQVTFDAAHLTSGVYLYRLEAAGQVFTRKLTLIK